MGRAFSLLLMKRVTWGKGLHPSRCTFLHYQVRLLVKEHLRSFLKAITKSDKGHKCWVPYTTSCISSYCHSATPKTEEGKEKKNDVRKMLVN